MVNYYDKNKFISKRELARLACVSDRTFSRYLAFIGLKSTLVFWLKR